MLMITPEALKLLKGPIASSVKSRRASITLAGPQRKHTTKPQTLSRARYEAILDRVLRLMRARTWSKFEFEGPARSGVRSALCLEGWRWPHADRVAAEIVEKALNRTGAVRPLWAEGQPSYTYDGLHDVTRCQWCHGKLSEDRHEAGARFCSVVCRSVAKVHRQTIAGEKMSRAEYLAACAVNRVEKLKESIRECESCGGPFVASDRENSFCSAACYHVSLRTLANRPCLHCGKEFKPRFRDDGKKYCSQDCASNAQVVPREDRFCVICGSGFRPKYPSDAKATCSQACAGKRRWQIRQSRIQCEAV